LNYVFLLAINYSSMVTFFFSLFSLQTCQFMFYYHHKYWSLLNKWLLLLTYKYENIIFIVEFGLLLDLSMVTQQII